MTRASICLAALLTAISFGSPAFGDDSPPAAAHLLIDISTAQTAILPQLDAAAQKTVAARLRDHFMAAGMDTVVTQWCANARCTSVRVPPATVHLGVRIGEPHEGGIERGLSFSLGDGDPRAPDFNRTIRLPLSCRLRDANKHLFSALDDTVIVNSRTLTANAVADAIAAACGPALVARTRDTGQAVRASIASRPDVYLERREVPVATATASAPPLAVVTSSAAGSPAATTGDGADGLQLVRQEDGSRTQYVFHNLGHSVLLEFGPRR